MGKNLYDVLGVKQGCKAEEIRTAYRKLVLKHHPDRSSDPKSTAIFIEVTQAYEVLSDPDQRRSYDHNLRIETQAKMEPAARPRPQPRPHSKPSATPSAKAHSPADKRTTVATEITRLSMLFTRGQYSDAEALAKRIISMDGHQPVPYAVLGDLARARGDLREASKMYAFAVQMDPGNSLYRRRCEELLDIDIVGAGYRDVPLEKGLPALAVGGGVALLTSIYLALAKEAAILPSVGLISSWTFGLVVMALLSGVVIGASLAIGEWVDRFASSTTNSLGRVAPPVALAMIAILSFWVAAGLYVILGTTQRSFSLSTSRLVAGVAFGVVLLSLGAAMSASLNGAQVFLWSGNLMYIGSLAGWFVSDAFRRT